MGVPTDRRYLASHEWHKLEGEICTIGISQFAADELTDVTYVSLPSPRSNTIATLRGFIIWHSWRRAAMTWIGSTNCW